MKRVCYTVILQSQMGPRAGELLLQEDTQAVSGYTDVKVSVGTKTPAEGETAGEPEITGVQATKNSITYTFKFVDQTTSAAAK